MTQSLRQAFINAVRLVADDMHFTWACLRPVHVTAVWYTRKTIHTAYHPQYLDTLVYSLIMGEQTETSKTMRGICMKPGDKWHFYDQIVAAKYQAHYWFIAYTAAIWIDLSNP